MERGGAAMEDGEMGRMGMLGEMEKDVREW